MFFVSPNNDTIRSVFTCLRSTFYTINYGGKASRIFNALFPRLRVVIMPTVGVSHQIKIASKIVEITDVGRCSAGHRDSFPGHSVGVDCFWWCRWLCCWSRIIDERRRAVAFHLLHLDLAAPRTGNISRTKQTFPVYSVWRRRNS